MAIIGGAAITAAGTLGAAAMSGGGGGGGMGGQSFTPISINTPGLRTSAGPDYVDVFRKGATTDALARMNLLSGNTARDLSRLRGLVQPGVGALTKARLGAIENRRTRTIGNLRDNLARRRVLGSSFAQDAISRAEAEFGKEEAEARATGFLQELDLTQQLIQQEFEVAMGPALQTLEQLNFETTVGVNLANHVQTAMTANNKLAAALAMDQQRLDFTRSQALGSFAQPALDALGTQFGNFLGSGSIADFRGTGSTLPTGEVGFQGF